MADDLITLRGVRKSFGDENPHEVLHGIDLAIRTGEFIALVGPSGSGKSTLLNIIGLLDVPTAGSVAVLGEETVGMSDARRTELRGRELGFVFQSHHLLPALTAAENVMLPIAASSGWVRASMRPRAVELLGQVGLAEKVDAPARELSGGQQQRVAVARALAMNPRCVLADEPTGNLDTKSAAQVFDLLRAMNAAGGPAFVIVTHNRAMAARCDRVVEVVDGNVSFDGRASEWTLR
jgi:lipoprotein-releasing system ATP-binding protein